MFISANALKSVEEGRRSAETMIASGQAREKFKQGFACKAVMTALSMNPSGLPTPRSQLEVVSPSTGYISGTNCQQFGVAPGHSRRPVAKKKEDAIDHSVGLRFHKRIGDRSKKANPWPRLATMLILGWPT